MFKFKLNSGEKLHYMVRQTEYVLIRPAVFIFVLIYISWYFIIKYEILDRFYLLLLGLTIILLAYGIYKYVLWLINVNLITNQRVIIICYKGLFNKKTQETGISEIANISHDKKGILATLFDFGNVEIWQANVNRPLILNKIRHPHKIRDLIWHSNTISH